MDYKERFIELLREMHKDNNAGLIAPMIAEGIKETCPEQIKWINYHLKTKK